MATDVVRVLTSNLKLLAVAVGAVALFGGTATTVALVDSSTPAPNEHASPKATESEAPETEDADDSTEAADEAGDTEDKTDDAGTRPTDTHGYCVSKAVAAAHAAGKTGQDVAAAAHSCPKPNDAAKAAKKAAKQGAKTHGKSSAAPGRQGS
jgi:hypothetical protein